MRARGTRKARIRESSLPRAEVKEMCPNPVYGGAFHGVPFGEMSQEHVSRWARSVQFT